MANLSYRFIDELLRFLDRSDAVSVSKLMKIKNDRYLTVYFKEDAKRYLSDKLENAQNDIYIWTEVIEYYILARNSLYNDDLPNAYDSLSKSFKSLVDLIKDAKGKLTHYLSFLFLVLYQNLFDIVWRWELAVACPVYTQRWFATAGKHVWC